VLGAFLLVGQQFGGQRGILFRRRAALAGAGNRTHGDDVTFEADQNFRRSADDVEILEIEIEHVRRRIEAAQRAVKGHRAGWKGLVMRCDSTTCMMSPSVMYSLALSTACLKAASPKFETAGSE
jgi:hypothetical protein